MKDKNKHYPENETINNLVEFCSNQPGTLKKTDLNDVSYCGIAGGEPIKHRFPFKGKLEIVSFYKNERLQKENRYVCSKKDK